MITWCWFWRHWYSGSTPNAASDTLCSKNYDHDRSRSILQFGIPRLKRFFCHILKHESEDRGERIIPYSNNIRITNIRNRIRPQIETRILFVFRFVQKFGSEYYLYSYSSKNLGPNIIRIRIRPKIWGRISFVFSFGYFENTNIIRLSIRPPIYRTGVNKKPFTW